MRTIDQYIDLARKNAEIKSDRELSTALGFRSNTVSHWRTKRAWPSDDMILRLADLAGVDEKTAILDLGIWTNSGRAKKVYSTLLERIGATVTTLLIAAGLASPAHAADTGFHITPKKNTLYIMENKGVEKPLSHQTLRESLEISLVSTLSRPAAARRPRGFRRPGRHRPPGPRAAVSPRSPRGPWTR